MQWYHSSQSLSLSKNAIELSATILNTERQNINTWLQLNKLSLYFEKIKFMIFTTVNKPINYPSLHIDGTTLEFDFLWIVFNKSMKWDGHVDKIANKIFIYIHIKLYTIL